jgi:hypothetical protein
MRPRQWHGFEIGSHHRGLYLLPRVTDPLRADSNKKTNIK